MRLSPHFSLHEMCRSQLASRLAIDNRPDAAAVSCMRVLCTQVLEPIRAHVKRPFSPSSGFRCRALNRALGSQDTSQHCLGQAVDVDILDLGRQDLAQWIVASLAFDQLIIEYPQADNVAAGWLHISFVTGGNRNETLTKTPAGYHRGFPAFW